MKVVLDTNVLINGIKDEYSYEKRILDEIIAGGIEAYANHQTMQENKLISGQLIDNYEYEKVLNAYYAQVNPVSVHSHVRVVQDREDNKILASAVDARVEFLITADHDLLNVKQYKGVKIVTPAAFWARYKDEGNDLWQDWAKFINSQNKK